MKQVLQRMLLICGSLVFSLSVFECGLRVSHYGSIFPRSGEHILRRPHPIRGWALAPNRGALQRSKDYAVSVEINSKGLRDRPHDYEPDPDVFRIVVLGDSFMEAYQVPLEDSLPYRLEESLRSRKVEVINLGVGGYGTAQEYLYLRDEGLRYQPDLVILAFFTGNDVQNNSRALQLKISGSDDLKVFGRPYAVATDLDSEIEWQPPMRSRVERHIEEADNRRAKPLRRITKFIEPTLVANLVEQAIAQAAEGTGPSTADPHVQYGWLFLDEFEGQSDWENAWFSTRRVLLETRRLSLDAGARFALLVVPTMFQVDDDLFDLVRDLNPKLSFDRMHINRELRDFCDEYDIAFFDPTPIFVEHARANESLYFRFDRHWNANGHALATEELIRFLDFEGLLPPENEAGSGTRSK